MSIHRRWQEPQLGTYRKRHAAAGRQYVDASLPQVSCTFFQTFPRADTSAQLGIDVERPRITDDDDGGLALGQPSLHPRRALPTAAPR